VAIVTRGLWRLSFGLHFQRNETQQFLYYLDHWSRHGYGLSFETKRTVGLSVAAVYGMSMWAAMREVELAYALQA